jgi:molecular chaperone Hsp33
MIGSSSESVGELTMDVLQPFQLEEANLRGRAARLGPTLTEMLSRHDYPPKVEQLLAEVTIVTVVLAGLLKYDGVFTLQAKGDGPVSLIVADVTTAGEIRAYARFDSDRLPAPGDPADARQLLGQGYLAFTVDQGEHSERYQGIVELAGESLADCLAHYFRQSEQLLTSVKLAARRHPEGWRAGAILLQRLPDDDAARVGKSHAEDAEDWNRANLLMATAAEVELLDRTLHLNNLLFRLFHQERIRVFPPMAVKRGCRCSEARVRRVLRSLDRAELDDMKLDGEVVVTCEFCSTSYRFDDRAIDLLFAGGDRAS